MSFFFLQKKELVISEEHIKIINKNTGVDKPYRVHTMGLYLVIETQDLVLMWNKKTTIMIKLKSTFKVGEQMHR